MPDPIVSIVMGSQSDLKVMQAASDRLSALEVPHEIDIVSAHRTPDRLVEFATSAEARGIQVIIAGAGGAAHLPGMVASMTVLPVVGVPVNATALNGEDSLLSIVQMPAGIPVATVAINNAENAGLLAAQIVATNDSELRRRLHEHRASLKSKVLETAAATRQEHRFD